ncbi:30S ribosomal protein S6 [Spirochaeta dissipatitropha]
MREYEMVCVFRAEDEMFQQGKEATKAELKKLNVTITKEDDMGQKTLAYEIDRQSQGHYYLFEFTAEPAAANSIDDVLRYQNELLRHLVVRKGE